MYVQNGNRAEKKIIKIIGNKGMLVKHNKTKGIDLIYIFNYYNSKKQLRYQKVNIEVKSAIRKGLYFRNTRFLVHLHQIPKNNVFAFVIYDSNNKYVYSMFTLSSNLLNVKYKNYIPKFLISEKQIKDFCKPKYNILDIISLLDK